MRFAGLCLSFLLAAITIVGTARAADPAWFGAAVETVTPAMMAEQGLAVPFGARVTALEQNSPAAAAGLAEGDVIISIDGKALSSAAEFEAEISAMTAGTVVQLMRFRGKGAPVAVEVTLAQDPTPALRGVGAAPTLMLDTGGHMAMIWDVEFTPDGKQLISISDDKTIRVWDLEKGRTVRIIRGEVEAGQPGKIYAMALSPDAKWLAVGGWTHNECMGKCGEIRLYDFASGALVGMFAGGHVDVVHSLAFSPNGKHLISGSSDKIAIIWDVATRTPKHRLLGHTLHIYGVGFTPDSARAVTGSFDTTLRLWSVEDGSQIALMTGHQDRIRTLAVSADGLIASGDKSGGIRIWDGRTGLLIKVLAQQVTGIGSLSFSPDSKYLLATCGDGAQLCGNNSDNVYDVASGNLVVAYGNHNNIVMGSDVSPDGRWAATAGGTDQEIHVWDLKTGAPRRREDGQPLFLKGNGRLVWAAAIAKDGRSIAWGYTWQVHTALSQNPLEYGLTLPSGKEPLGRPVPLDVAAAAQYYRAVTKHGPVSLRHRNARQYADDQFLDIVVGDKVHATIERQSYSGFQHRSYTFTPDGKSFISAGDGGYLEAYDLNGASIGRYIGHTGDVWSVTTSADGRYLLSSSSDQTVCLWNLKSRELIATLFFGSEGEWVMWTPQGYYTGSPGGGELVGWQINQGADKEALYVRGRQLRDKLLRPDIVERAIELASATAAVREAGLASMTVETLLTQTPPVLLARAWETEAVGGRGTVMVATEKNALAVLDTKFTVSDGTQETAVKPRPLPLPPGTPQPEAGTTLRAFEVPLFKGKNTVRVVAVNGAGESEPQEVVINHNGEGALDKRGTLWVLAVGADKYPGAKQIADPATGQAFRYPDLQFAGADARAFADATIAHMQASHAKTEVTVLVNGAKDGEPSKANILAALSRIKTQSADTDTVVILLAGHGENWTGGRYHFLPTDFKRLSMADLGENVIDWKDDVQPAIAGAKGRKVLFLDACYSGNAYNNTLLASADADRFVAFSAAGPGQKASEFAAEGHGAFTYMLIEALKGADAALDPLENGVTVYKLGDYVNLKVRERTYGKQTPEFRSGQGNFVLTRM